MLEQLEYTCLQGDVHILVTELVYDSRKVTRDCVFVCVSGAVFDGHDFIGEVAAKGAAAIVIEKDVPYPEGITVIRTANTRHALACMSAAYFGYPARRLITIGITGTKGKTTTAYMIRSMLEETGHKTGLIGTIETIIGDESMPSGNTTPESYVLQQTFARMVDAGCECVVMEASSQGFMLHRTDGFIFDYGIFTNIAPDHIGQNEHKDFEDYLRCKSMLFRQCRTGIVNIDDPHAKDILEGHTCRVETFGYSRKAQIAARDVRLLNRPGYLGIAYHASGLIDLDVEVPIPGKFSVYNSLCAIALCRNFKIDGESIKRALGNVSVKGRVELVPVSDKFTVIIDYAHNAMSLQSLLTTLREYNPKRLVCMFGCGGNRARERRFEMGEISSRLADLTVVTSDNPRYEEPMDIINDIITGVKRGPGKYVEIQDRAEAVKYCITNAIEGDVIVITGKGHEDYQEIKGVKYHMDDRELVIEAASLL
jgi:UDP-N-acetylmuramoyl-L-alanyl-D-glutamate--2,6-diaminopimelate ligase